jgi:molecular chaperone GrpE
MTIMSDAFEENDAVSQESENSDRAGNLKTIEAVVAELENRLKECQIQTDNYLDQWRRTAAEFANYKKRAERENAEATRFCNAALITRLLPVLDDIDRAFVNLPDDLAGNPWVEGMMLVQRKFHSIFEQEGVQEIKTEEQMFDPVLHEAVTHESNDSVPEGYVLGEVEKGYRLNDRVLRPAKVRVSAG